MSIIIILIIVIGCLLFYFYMTNYNKVTELVIKLNETENQIDNSLRNKYDILNSTISIIKGKSKKDNKIFNELVKIKSIKISNFELDRLLIDANNEIITIISKDSKLETNDDIISNNKKIEKENKKLDNYKKYYNDHIIEYNKLIKCFPTNIVCSINKYKEKTFYDGKDMNDDDTKDFKL